MWILCKPSGERNIQVQKEPHILPWQLASCIPLWGSLLYILMWEASQHQYVKHLTPRQRFNCLHSWIEIEHHSPRWNVAWNCTQLCEKPGHFLRIKTEKNSCDHAKLRTVLSLSHGSVHVMSWLMNAKKKRIQSSSRTQVARQRLVLEREYPALIHWKHSWWSC